MLLIWHKNNKFPKVQPKVQWHDQQLPPTSFHWQQCLTMKIIGNLHLILKLLLYQKRHLILRCCFTSKLLTNQNISYPFHHSLNYWDFVVVANDREISSFVSHKSWYVLCAILLKWMLMFTCLARVKSIKGLWFTTKTKILIICF